jgi:beta-lactam-binding protein with PASTA domain
MLKRLLTYLLIAIGTVAAVAVILNLAMSFLVGGRQVTVPDLRGLDERDAFQELDRMGLKGELVDEEFNMEYPESTVADQNPLPGRVVKQGRKVFVTMSRGGEFHEVPYCVGKPLRTAEIIVERAGFVVGSVARIHTRRGYPEEVLGSEPGPGKRAVRGSRVNILVNDGPADPKVILPDLKAHSYLAVKIALERLGLLVQETNIDKDFNPLRAKVVLQRPPAGFVVSRGDTVMLVISSRAEEERNL